MVDAACSRISLKLFADAGPCHQRRVVVRAPDPLRHRVVQQSESEPMSMTMHEVAIWGVLAGSLLTLAGLALA